MGREQAGLPPHTRVPGVRMSQSVDTGAGKPESGCSASTSRSPGRRTVLLSPPCPHQNPPFPIQTIASSLGDTLPTPPQPALWVLGLAEVSGRGLLRLCQALWVLGPQVCRGSSVQTPAQPIRLALEQNLRVCLDRGPIRASWEGRRVTGMFPLPRQFWDVRCPFPGCTSSLWNGHDTLSRGSTERT